MTKIAAQSEQTVHDVTSRTKKGKCETVAGDYDNKVGFVRRSYLCFQEQ